jgi:hypothetical protein
MMSTVFFTLWAGPKAPGTAALSRAAVIKAGPEQEVDGIGSLRRMPPIEPGSVGPFETSLDDGTRFLVLRFPTEAAPAARLYIRDMALPVGAKLFLYGLDTSGSVTTADGPFEGAGPLQSGEFWSSAIVGSDIVVELQAGEDLLADIPFEIVGFAPADPSEVQTDLARNSNEVRTSIFRNTPLTHTVKDGIAIFEGDIELGNAGELSAANSKESKGRRGAVAITGTSYRWKNGIIPYAIDPALPTPTRVTAAITHWNTALEGYIKWVPRTSETAYVQFARAASSSTCSSSVGMLGYAQKVQVGDSCSKGNIIHEMGHAVGLWHEQGREDRDEYVKVLWENIQQGLSYNFTQNIYNGEDVGFYDYGSIMHYPANGFSGNGKATIETIPPGIPIGQRTALSQADISAVRAIYPRTASSNGMMLPTTLNITLTSIPTGQTLTADGVNYKTPKTLQWAPGSVHTITAVTPPIVNGVRNVFVRWTDGGAQTHTIVTPPTSMTYRADYATSYATVATATAPGTVTLSPVSPDTFYAQNTYVALEATPPSDYCFTSWTGMVAGTPPKTNLKISKAYTVQANFVPGGISVSPAALAAPTSANTQEISVSGTTGCMWKATSPVSWIKITQGATGAGPGVVTLSISARTTTKPRTATLTIADMPVVVTQ